MSSGKWKPPAYRGIQLKNGTYWLRLNRDGKWRSWNLGKDEIAALALARDIREGREPDLERLIDQIKSQPDYDKREEQAYAASMYVDAEYGEQKSAEFYGRATGHVAELKEFIGDDVAQTTINDRLAAIRRSGLRFLSDCPDRMQAYHVLEHLKAQGFASNTIANTLNVLALIYSNAEDRGMWSGTNPFKKLRYRQQRSDKRALTPSELEAVLEVAGPITQAWITLLACTGLRLREAVNDSKFEDGLLKVVRSKTSTGLRSFPLTPRALIAFQTAQDSHRAPRTVQRRIKDAYDAVGLQDVDIHSLRRTTATALASAGVPEHISASILGHRHKALSYGLYAAGPSFDQKLGALLNAEKWLFD